MGDVIKLREWENRRKGEADKEKSAQENQRHLRSFTGKTIRKFEVSDPTESPWQLNIAVENEDREIIIRIDDSLEESYYQESLLGSTLEEIILGDYEVIFVLKKPDKKEKALKVKYKMLLITPPTKTNPD
jgi:hypothetical protein